MPTADYATSSLSLGTNPVARYQGLDPSKFEISHDIPIFDEHEVEEPERDEHGKVTGTKRLRYTRKVLEAMAENMNRRIHDTGDLTGLCLGHTPTPDERKLGIPQPDLVGFAGPFYVGTIGESKPRAAIIAKDWAIFKDEVDRVRKFPRRSVEVWREPKLTDRYIEPIALLGAETPRRDLGLAYSRLHQGVAVERYTAMAPSGTNTFMPGVGKTRYKCSECGCIHRKGKACPKCGSDKYEEMEIGAEQYEQKEKQPEPQRTEKPRPRTGTRAEIPPHPHLSFPKKAKYSAASEGNEMLTDDDVNKIVAAVCELDFAKWATDQMQATQAKGSDTQIPPEAMLGPDGQPMEDPGMMGDEDPMGMGDEPGMPPGGEDDGSEPDSFQPQAEDNGMDANEPGKPNDETREPVGAGVGAPEPKEKEPQHYHANGDADKGRKQAEDRYSKIEAHNKVLTERLNAIEQRAVQTERYAYIDVKKQVYVMDEDAEYARADKYSKEQWDEHCKIIENYARNPAGFAPMPVMRATKTGSAIDEKVLYAKVQERANRNLEAGKHKTFTEIEAEVRAELGQQ